MVVKFRGYNCMNYNFTVTGWDKFNGFCNATEMIKGRFSSVIDLLIMTWHDIVKPNTNILCRAWGTYFIRTDMDGIKWRLRLMTGMYSTGARSCLHLTLACWLTPIGSYHECTAQFNTWLVNLTVVSIKVEVQAVVSDDICYRWGVHGV